MFRYSNSKVLVFNYYVSQITVEMLTRGVQVGTVYVLELFNSHEGYGLARGHKGQRLVDPPLAVGQCSQKIMLTLVLNAVYTTLD